MSAVHLEAKHISQLMQHRGVLKDNIESQYPHGDISSSNGEPSATQRNGNINRIADPMQREQLDEGGFHRGVGGEACREEEFEQDALVQGRAFVQHRLGGEERGGVRIRSLPILESLLLSSHHYHHFHYKQQHHVNTNKYIHTMSPYTHTQTFSCVKALNDLSPW